MKYKDLIYRGNFCNQFLLPDVANLIDLHTEPAPIRPDHEYVNNIVVANQNNQSVPAADVFDLSKYLSSYEILKFFTRNN